MNTAPRSYNLLVEKLDMKGEKYELSKKSDLSV